MPCWPDHTVLPSWSWPTSWSSGCDWSLDAGRQRLKVDEPVGKSALVHLPDGRLKEIGSGSHELSHG
jgi:hypothetical protein